MPEPLSLEIKPVAQESKPDRGFPTPEAEREMSKKFFREYTPEAIRYCNETLKWKPTGDQLELFLEYLYGIYFVNQITGGELFDKDFSPQQLTKWHLQPRNPVTFERPEKLDINNLDNWPIRRGYNLNLGHKSHASADIVSGTVSIYPDQIPNTDPDTVVKGGDLPDIDLFRFLFPRKVYQLPLRIQWRLTGMEEAHHIYLAYIEEKNQGFPRKEIHSTENQGPLRNLALREDARKSVRNYNSLLGNEFAAHVLQSQYLQHYYPHIYRQDYQAFDKSIRHARKIKLTQADSQLPRR